MVWMVEGVGYFVERERERERERVRGDLENKDNDAYKIWVLLTGQNGYLPIKY